MRYLGSLCLLMALMGCGSGTEKIDPFASAKRRLDVPDCATGYNPSPLDRGDGTRLAGIEVIPEGNYTVQATKIHFLTRDRKLTAVTYMEHAGGSTAQIVCTNFTLEHRFGFVFPGFATWTKAVKEAVIGRSFTFLWDEGTGSVAVSEGWSTEDSSMAAVLRFFNSIVVYDLGNGRYDIRGERLEVVGNKRFRTGASFEFKRRG